MTANHTVEDGLPLQVLRNALNSTRSAIVITDAKKKDNPIIYCNQAFLELSGYSADEVIGSNCRFMQGKDTDANTIDSIRTAINNTESLEVTIKNYKKDGTPFWNDLIMSPVIENGELTHFVGMQLDITNRVNYQHELEKSQQALKNSNDELQQFTYAASHDLQEPLRMVSSFVQLLEKNYGNKIDVKGKEYIAFAVNGAERMQTLINDLLLLSRVRTKRQAAEYVQLSTVVDAALFNLTVTIEESHADITTDIKNELINIEEVQMIQVFQNIISNALKYRDPKIVPKIRIAATRKDSDVTIAITDNGIGIEEKYHERIFEVFQRLHTRTEYPGNGIGLSLCKKIIEQHGGILSVESVPGQGSTFIITLPGVGK